MVWPSKGNHQIGKKRFFRRIYKSEAPSQDQRGFRIRTNNNTIAFFKEIVPFNLTLDECGCWLTWGKFPNPENIDVEALTLIYPWHNPSDPILKRGIANFLSVSELGELVAEFISGMRNQTDPVSETALISMDDCRSFLLSLLGDTCVDFWKRKPF